MHFGKIRIDELGLLGGSKSLLGKESIFAVAVEAQVGVGNAGIGQGEIGVLLEGALHQVNSGFGIAAAFLATQCVAALQVEIVGRHVFGGMETATGDFFAAGLEVEPLHDARVNLVFQRE